MPTVDYLKAVTILDDAATLPILALHGVQKPKFDLNLYHTYARHFYAKGWLSHPPALPSIEVKKVPIPTNGSLAGRVAVITGASSGIGAAVAAALVAKGVHVALAARRTSALEAVQTKIKPLSTGSKILLHPTDVIDRTQVESLIATTAKELGPVDILIVCAGVMYYTLMSNAHVQEWDQTVDVNCKGLLHSLSATVPSMLARGSGHIVAISSDAGRKVFPGLGVYSASKFFVEATLQSLRLETAGTGLRVTSVQPGNTKTDLLQMSSDAEAVKKYGTPSGATILDPEDVARAIVYALEQPGHVAVNEVLIEPRDEPI
jgi:NADP-dependent 3-hydroxy acid dehydrogenase YdfG